MALLAAVAVFSNECAIMDGNVGGGGWHQSEGA